MTRTDVLRDLLDHGRDYDMPRLEQLAAALGLPVADVLVVAGHPVQGRLLPPDRDGDVVRAFAYRVTFCNHPQLAALREFLRALPDVGAAPESRPARDLADRDPFPAILQGLMDNRGFGVYMSSRSSGCRGAPSWACCAGSGTGWCSYTRWPGRWDGVWRTWPPSRARNCTSQCHFPMLCHHVGAVFVAAVPRTTEQLVHTAREADRLSAREDHGAWQPFSEGIDDCPDWPSGSWVRRLDRS